MADRAITETPAAPDVTPAVSRTDVAIEMIDVNKWFGDFHVLKNINLTRHARRADRRLRAVGLGQIDHDPLHQPARGAPEAAASSSTASS